MPGPSSGIPVLASATAPPWVLACSDRCPGCCGLPLVIPRLWAARGMTRAGAWRNRPRGVGGDAGGLGTGSGLRSGFAGDATLLTLEIGDLGRDELANGIGPTDALGCADALERVPHLLVKAEDAIRGLVVGTFRSHGNTITSAYALRPLIEGNDRRGARSGGADYAASLHMHKTTPTWPDGDSVVHMHLTTPGRSFPLDPTRPLKRQIPVDAFDNWPREPVHVKHLGDMIGECGVLYRFRGADEELLYVGITGTYVQARWYGHRTKEWWPLVRSVSVEPTSATMSVAKEIERKAIIAERPKYNVVHLRRRAVVDVRLDQGASEVIDTFRRTMLPEDFADLVAAFRAINPKD